MIEKSLRLKPGQLEKMLARGEMKLVKIPTVSPPQERDGTPDFEKAKSIFGKDFLGYDAVKKAFGINIAQSKVPAIPFTLLELERARTLDQFLSLRIDTDSAGNPLTMQRMQEMLADQFERDQRGGIFFKTDWYKGEDFFTKDTPRVTWALVFKEVMPDSIGKNYLEQTQVLSDYLSEGIFQGQPLPGAYQNAISEFTKEEPLIQVQISGNWRPAAEKLSELKLNQLIRRTAVEVAYDELLYFQNNNQRLLPTTYDRTQTCTSGSYLVGMGGFDSYGLNVSYWRPAVSNSYSGVCPSR